MSGKSERQAARSVVADYHHAQLAELVAHVGEAVDRYRVGELDPFEVDHVLFHYSRAAKELWKFCNSFPVEMAAAMIREQPPPDWWERGAPRARKCRRFRSSDTHSSAAVRAPRDSAAVGAPRDSAAVGAPRDSAAERLVRFCHRVRLMRDDT